MSCFSPSSVVRSAPVNSRQLIVPISVSKRRRNSCAAAAIRSQSSMVSPRSILRLIAITAPTTAPQTAPVLPIPPPNPLAIRGMASFPVSISNSWHTASNTDSDQTWPCAIICMARFCSIIFSFLLSFFYFLPHNTIRGYVGIITSRPRIFGSLTDELTRSRAFFRSLFPSPPSSVPGRSRSKPNRLSSWAKPKESGG